MDLDEYLWRNKITQKRFAEIIGMNHNTLCGLIHKKITPTLINALNIVKVTNGDVDIETLVKLKDKGKML